ncbi:Abi family protein [Ureibacillus sp. MALMAid1270]|uniref:Abi family protein n=1 Tax=Ureibacillus sp. MALMAid1270 TaxID=3411629 RepID=UPI003BA4918B
MTLDKDESKIKPPTTFKEQVELFKGRKLHVEDSEFAEKTLQRINYYRLTAYGLTLKNPYNKDEYRNGASFNKLLSLYDFDRRLRLLLLGVLETIEIAVRTHISYETAHELGPIGYRDKDHFLDATFHQASLNELDLLIDKSRKSELFVKHHFEKYEGVFPIWAAIEVASFGFISKFYRNLKLDLKRNIAKTYYDVPYIYLESWLQTLSNVRNVCAHYGRIYNKHLTFKPRLFKEDSKYFNNKHIYGAIYIMVRLLTKREGSRFIMDLDALISEYEEHIDFSHIGFPVNWKEILGKYNSEKII